MSSRNLDFDVSKHAVETRALPENTENPATPPRPGFTGTLSRASPSSDKSSASRRVVTLDGLRGFLAFGVFLDHASIYQYCLRDGVWRTPSALFRMFGQVGVSLFFMVTAYLFYSRLIDENGRPDWLRLYIGRLFRIAPVYLLAVFAMFATVAVASDFRLRVPAGQLAAEILCWLSLGAAPGVDVNAYPETRHLLAGVTWTLQSEWLFYGSLPLLAFATRRGPVSLILMPTVGLALTLAYLAIFAPGNFPACVAPFFAGMLCAALSKTDAPLLPDRIASLLIVAIAGIFLVTGIDPRSPPAILLLGITFYLVISGCTIFGLLTTITAQWSGTISYGIYMLHGLVLFLLCTVPDVRVMALSSPSGHWIIMIAAAALVFTVAAVAHLFLERPGIEIGRRVARAWVEKRGALPSTVSPTQETAT